MFKSTGAWRRLTFIFCLSISGFCSAQEVVRKGHIITLDGDTIPGFIAEEKFLREYTVCRFSESEDGQFTSYEPYDILGYQVNGGYYFKSASLDLGHGMDGAVFFETVEEGRVTLYRFRQRLIIEKGSAFTELKNEQELVMHEDKKFSVDVYKKQLQDILIDCSWIVPRIRKTNFHVNAVKKLVRMYNEYGHLENDPQMSRRPVSFLLGGHVEISSSVLKLNLDTFEQKALAGSFDQSISVYPGLLIQVGSPRLSERTMLVTGFTMSSDVHLSYHIQDFSGVINYYDIVLETRQWRIPLGIAYYFPQDKFRPYASGGGIFTQFTSSEAHQIHEAYFDGIVLTREKEPFNTHSNTLGLWIGVGTDLAIHSNWNVFAEFRFQYHSRIMDNNFIPGSSVSVFSLMTGIKLSK